MNDLLIASGNFHKVEEIKRILYSIKVKWKTIKDFDPTVEPDENGSTYEENAAIKARFWSDKTGHWTLSDDSGIEVDAMDGRPGIHSARYGDGDGRITKMLEELSDVPDGKRSARFICVVCLCSPTGDCHYARGVVEGSIASAVKGSGGFGYDPIFIPDENPSKHFSELTEDEKNALSHRGRALRALKSTITELL